MKLILLILITFLLNGCNEPDLPEPEPCKEQECYYPHLPTYKVPASKKFTKPINQGDGTCIVVITELLELSNNNKTLRGIVWKHTAVNIKVNERYSSAIN